MSICQIVLRGYTMITVKSDCLGEEERWNHWANLPMADQHRFKYTLLVIWCSLWVVVLRLFVLVSCILRSYRPPSTPSAMPKTLTYPDPPTSASLCQAAVCLSEDIHNLDSLHPNIHRRPRTCCNRCRTESRDTDLRRKDRRSRKWLDGRGHTLHQ